MEELIELLEQIQELAGIAIEALVGALEGAGAEGGPPPGEGGAPPEGPPPGEGGPPPEEDLPPGA